MKKACLSALIAAILCASFLSAWGGDAAPDHTPTFQIPRIANPPVIDGTIDPEEWKGAMAVSGVTEQGSNELIPRPTTFFLAWDKENIYMACRAWMMPGRGKPHCSGRETGAPNCGDDGMELHWQPLGKNVPTSTSTTSSYKWITNMLGFSGDAVRVSVGQLFRNWEPKFKSAARQLPYGSAPNGGAWLECEFSASWKDFELTGPHQAGDLWKMMLGFDQLPGWIQARIPCYSGYFDPSGYCRMTLAEDVPAVQVTMEDLPNVCYGQAAVTFKVYNPAAHPTALKIFARYAEFQTKKEGDKNVTSEVELLKKEADLEVEAGKAAEFKINEKFPRDPGKNLCAMEYLVKMGDKEIFKYYAPFRLNVPEYMVKIPPPTDAFPFDVGANPIRSIITVSGDSYYLDKPEDALKMDYSVTKKGDAQPIFAKTIDKSQLYFFRDMVKLPPLAEGEYEVSGTITLKDGKVLGPVIRPFKKLDEPKAFASWWDNKLGNTERVIPPFTPLELKGATVSLLGRSYRLGKLGLFESVVSQKEEVLAGPIRIVAVVNGKEEEIDIYGQPKITETQPWRVSFEGDAQGAGLSFKAKGWIEQDGWAQFSITYAPSDGKAAKVDALRIEIPVATEQAECLTCIGPGGNFSHRTTAVLPTGKQGRLWSSLGMGRAGSLTAKGSFMPLVWLGSERRGLMWWGDSDRGWFPEDDVTAHEVVRDGGQAILRNNIIGKTVSVEGERTFTFGLSATPFKPFPKNWRYVMYSADSTFCGGGDCGEYTLAKGDKVRLDWKMTVRPDSSGRYFDGWSLLTPPSDDPADWPGMWAKYKSLSDQKLKDRWNNPAGARNGVFSHTSLALYGYGCKSADKEVVSYLAPELGDHEGYTKPISDYYTYLLNRAITEGGLRANYWDISFPSPTWSLTNEMAYVLPNGKTQIAYPGFNTRRHMQRMYSLYTDHGLAPGCQVSHATNAYLLVMMPWIDAILDGEFHKLTDLSACDWVDGYPIEHMRALATPANWGLPISWMDHIEVTGEKGNMVRRGKSDYVRMFDSWCGMTNYSGPQSAIEWGILDESVQFVPFWRNPFVTCADKEILISMWKQDGRVLVQAFNYNGKQEKDAVIKLDLAKLGLARHDGTLAVRLLSAPGEAVPTLDAVSGNISITGILPHTGRLFGIRHTEKSAGDALAGQIEDIQKKIDAQAVPNLVDELCDNGFAELGTQFLEPGKTPDAVCQDKDIDISMWQRNDRVLLAVVNKDEKIGKNAVIALDLDKLGLRQKLPTLEFVRVRDFPDLPQGQKSVLDYEKKTLAVNNIAPRTAKFVAVRKY